MKCNCAKKGNKPHAEYCNIGIKKDIGAKIILTIQIEVWGIEVEETSKKRGWYEFKYSFKDGKGKQKTGRMDGSWSSQTKSHFYKVLSEGWAHTLVIQKYF